MTTTTIITAAIMVTAGANNFTHLGFRAWLGLWLAGNLGPDR